MNETIPSEPQSIAAPTARKSSSVFPVIRCVDGSGTLMCPYCESVFTHHERIEVFDRSEDAKRGVHFVVDAEKVVVDADLSGNPSCRRHGLLIYLWCEECQRRFVLAISQHKGCTEVYFPRPDTDAMSPYACEWMGFHPS